MTIDKSWTKITNRFSVEFKSGLNAFIERCKDHLSEDGQCRCPCEKCHNHRWHYPNNIHRHIHRWGFSETYLTWKYHGEQLDPVVIYDTTNEMVDVRNDVCLEDTGNDHNMNSDETSNEPYLREPHGKLVKDGVEALFAERYRKRKSTFKGTWFIDRGGYDDPVQIRCMPPPNMSVAEWNKYCDYYLNVKTKKLAEVNVENQEKQIIPSLHGTRSYVAHGHKDLEKDGEYPGFVKSYGKMHKKLCKGAWAHTEAKTRYNNMVDLQDSETVTMDEHAILGKVLGVCSEYNPGRGRKLPGHASASTSGAQPRMYTEEQVDRKIGKVVIYLNNQFDAFYSALESANIRVPLYKKLEAQDFDEDDKEDEE